MSKAYRQLKALWPRRRDQPTDEVVAPADRSYDLRVASEYRQFNESRPADELPEIYQYWSNTFLRPRLLRSGFDGPLGMFRHHLADAYEKSPADVRRFLSIGSGDCQTEIALAEHLIESGKPDFVFECFELNPTLVARGNALALDRGVAGRISILAVDANTWSPSREYDGVLANSSLHHIQNLEGVFDGIARSLLPSGTFITSDTIGRNGHMRWPEALDIVQEYWNELPEQYRFNCQLRRQERDFVNWDCSGEGFEGIRAQDILPLLIQRFDFDFFAAFANIVDPFIDRTFGHNFDSSRDWDREFVDRIEVRDNAEIRRGRIKPTHMVAAMCVGRPGKNVFMEGLTPQFCVRDPSRAPRPLAGLESAVESSRVEAPPTGSTEEALELGVEIVPAQPQCNDYLVARIHFEAGGNTAGGEELRRPVEVRIRSEGVLRVAATGETLELGLGNFVVGDVHVDALAGSFAGTRTIEVAARPTPPGLILPLLDYSDLWWNPTEPGWGVSIHQHPNGQLVAFWLGYGREGSPTWLSLHPGGWETCTRFEGLVHRHCGSSLDKPYDPSELVDTVVGKGVLEFRTATAGRLTWEHDNGCIVKDIERMAF